MGITVPEDRVSVGEDVRKFPRWVAVMVVQWELY